MWKFSAPASKRFRSPRLRRLNRSALRGCKLIIQVILPLALRICLPALTNNLVNLVKTTTLAYAIAVPELLYVSNQIWSDNENVPEMMLVLFVIYIALVGILVFRDARMGARLAPAGAWNMSAKFPVILPLNATLRRRAGQPADCAPGPLAWHRPGRPSSFSRRRPLMPPRAGPCRRACWPSSHAGPRCCCAASG